MTTIHATCKECLRDVKDLRTTAVMMTVYDSDPTGEQGYYSFFCPLCTEESKTPLSSDLINLLSSAGVRTNVVHVPEEFLEPKGGPVISPDDILDFCIKLYELEVIDTDA